jgi:parallel beta-helix repeat protein
MSHKIRYVAIAAAAGGLAIAGTTLAEARAEVGAQTSTAVTQVSCSGQSGDSTTLSNAIAAVPEGGTLAIAGTCYLTQPLVLTAGKTYEGTTGDGANDGVGTVLSQHFSGGYLVANDAYAGNTASDGTGLPLTVQDLAINCDSSSTDGLVVMAWQVNVNHVDATGCESGIVDTNSDAAGQAMPSGHTSVNSRFDDNFLQDNADYGFYVDDTQNAVTDGFFDDNQVASSGENAVELDNAAGWNIAGNHLYGDKQDGIYANRMWGSTISDNYIEDFGDGQSSGSWYGILGTNQCGIGSTIDDNMIFNDGGQETTSASYVYLAVSQNSSDCSGFLTVNGNVIYDQTAKNTATGMDFRGNGTADSLTIGSAGNIARGVATSRTTSGADVFIGGE